MNNKLLVLFVMLFITVSSVFALNETGLRNSYRIDNLITTNEIDSAGNDNVTADTTAMNTSGKINSGAIFSGSEKFYNFNYNFSPSAYSVSLWMFSDGTSGTTTQRFFSTQNETLDAGSGIGFNGAALAYRDSTKFFRYIHDNNGFINGNVIDITDATFHHVVVIWTGSYINTYVDNTLIDNISYNQTITDSGGLWIGESSQGLANWNGKMDEITVWNRSLSASEVSEIFNSGIGVQLPITLDDAILSYSFDDGIFDDSGNDHVGSNTGTTNTSGILNSARQFTSSGNQWIDILNDSTDFDFGTGDFTYSMWINYDSLPSATNTLVGSPSFDEISIIAASPQKAYFLVSNTDSLQTSTFPNSSQWYHLVAKRESGTIYIYKDGNLDSTNASSPTSVDISDLFIGRRNGDIRFWDGKIDQFMIYDRALDDIEISTLYNNGLGYDPYSGVILGESPELAWGLNSIANNTLVNNDGIFIEVLFNSSDISFYNLVFNGIEYNNSITCVGSTNGVCNGTITGLSNGVYDYYFSMTNSYGTTSLENRTVTIDLIPPEVYIYSPANNSEVTTPVLFNVSINSSNNLSLIFYDNGSSNTTLYNVTNIFETQRFYEDFDDVTSSNWTSGGISASYKYNTTKGLEEPLNSYNDAPGHPKYFNFTRSNYTPEDDGRTLFVKYMFQARPVTSTQYYGMFGIYSFNDSSQDGTFFSGSMYSTSSWPKDVYRLRYDYTNDDWSTITRNTELAVNGCNIAQFGWYMGIINISYYNSTYKNFTLSVAEADGTLKCTNSTIIDSQLFDQSEFWTMGVKDAHISGSTGYYFDEVLMQTTNDIINTSFVNNFSTDFNLALNDGSYKYTFYGKDVYNSINSSSVLFTVNNANPMFTDYGRVGGALIFDGENDYLTVSNFNHSGSTASMWVNRSGEWEFLVERGGVKYTNLVVNASEELPYVLTNDTLYIGNYSNGSMFGGVLDEFQYYDFNLSDAQLSLNYNNGLLGLPNFQLSDEETFDNNNYSALISTDLNVTSEFNDNLVSRSNMEFMQLDFFPLPHAEIDVQVRDIVFNNSIAFSIDFFGTINNYSYNWTPTLIPFCTPDNETDCYEVPNFLVDLEEYNISIYTSDGLNTCEYSSEVFDEEIIYNLTSCEVYNSNLYVHAYSGYNNDTIENFTVTITSPDRDSYDWGWQENFSETKTAIGKFVEFNLTKGANYTLLFTHPDIVNYTLSNYYLENSSQTLNQSLSETNITFELRHIATGNLLNGITVTITDINNSFVYVTSNGILNFNPETNINLYFTFNATNYATITENFTFSGGEMNTYNISMEPIVNLTFRDEKTFGLFNMMSPDQIKAELYCEDGSVVDQIISNSSSILPFTISCGFQKIRFLVDYPTEAYYRVIVISPTINQTNFNVWLVDLNNSKVVFNTFQGYDLFDEYVNPKIAIYRLINVTEELITGDFVDIEGKITAFLLLNEEYTIKVFSDNQPDRIIGRYNADDSGVKYLRLFDVSLSATPSGFSPDVYYYAYLVNESGSYNIKVAYNDTTGNNIYGGTLEIRNMTIDGNLLFSSSSNNTEAIFTYPTLNGVNDDNVYYINLTLLRVTGEKVPFIKALQDAIAVNLPEFENPWTIKWLVYIIILIVGFSMTIRTAMIGNILILALLLILAALNIFVISTSATITAGVIGILALIAISSIFKKGA